MVLESHMNIKNIEDFACGLKEANDLAADHNGDGGLGRWGQVHDQVWRQRPAMLEHLRRHGLAHQALLLPTGRQAFTPGHFLGQAGRQLPGFAMTLAGVIFNVLVYLGAFSVGEPELSPNHWFGTPVI